MNPSPVVALNRAVAVSRVRGPADALLSIEALKLDGYYLFHTVRGHLLLELSRHAEAAGLLPRSAEVPLLRTGAAIHPQKDGILLARRLIRQRKQIGNHILHVGASEFIRRHGSARRHFLRVLEMLNHPGFVAPLRQPVQAGPILPPTPFIEWQPRRHSSGRSARLPRRKSGAVSTTSPFSGVKPQHQREQIFQLRIAQVHRLHHTARVSPRRDLEVRHQPVRIMPFAGVEQIRPGLRCIARHVVAAVAVLLAEIMDTRPFPRASTASTASGPEKSIGVGGGLRRGAA